MLHIISGKRTARIRKFSDHSHRCANCGTYDLSVRVYRQYFHLFFIPAFSFGEKTAMIQCKACGAVYRSDTLQNHYEKRARAPFYLYSWPILVCLLILAAMTDHYFTKKEEAVYIQRPLPGDIYTIRPTDEQIYYFLKVVKVKNDSVITYRNSVQYKSYVSEPNETDSFTHEEKLISRKDLQDMFDNGVIESVDRSNK